MSDTHKTTLKQANQAIAAGDFEGFLSFCTEDTTWRFVGDKTLVGKVAVREWMATAYQGPPLFDVHQMIADGDRLCVLGEITLNDEAGQAVRHAYCDVWQFRNGQLAELHAFVIAGPLDEKTQRRAS